MTTLRRGDATFTRFVDGAMRIVVMQTPKGWFVRIKHGDKVTVTNDKNVIRFLMSSERNSDERKK